MNLWQIITSNSTLPVQAGNTLWNHLNNQAGGAGGNIFVGPSLIADIDMTLEAEIGDVLSSNLLMDELTANIVDDLSAETDGDLGASI